MARLLSYPSKEAKKKISNFRSRWLTTLSLMTSYRPHEFHMRNPKYRTPNVESQAIEENYFAARHDNLGTGSASKDGRPTGITSSSQLLHKIRVQGPGPRSSADSPTNSHEPNPAGGEYRLMLSLNRPTVCRWDDLIGTSSNMPNHMVAGGRLVVG